MDRELQELLDKINKKLKEINSLKGLSSKDFKFKTWHATTINILKMLPSDFISDVNNFKKLTFSDTKYHRGAKPFNPLDNAKFIEDLNNASIILKKITSVKKEKVGKTSRIKKESKAEEKKLTPKKPSSSRKKRATGTASKTKK